MPRPVALFDIDKTIYKGFSFPPLMLHQIEEGLVEPEVEQKIARAHDKFVRGELSYEELVHDVVVLQAQSLRSRPYDEAVSSARRFYEPDQFFPFAEPVIDKLNKTHDVYLVTGQSQIVGLAVAELFRTDYYSTQFEVKDGIFTGRVSSFLATRHEKREAIKHLMEGHLRKGSFAFGDSEGDIEMLRAADHAICIDPSPGLEEVAKSNHWHIAKPKDVVGLVDELLEQP